jgi:hypothetical protein
VFKTEFLLGCLSEPQPRARIRRDLLEVEQRQASARDADDGRRDRINAAALHEQTRTARLVSFHPDDRGGRQVSY